MQLRAAAWLRSQSLTVLDKRNSARLRLAVATLVVVMVTAGPLVAPQSPTQTSLNIMLSPSTAHLLGTDALGRDVLSRLLAGGQSLTLMSLASGAGAVLLGTCIGLVSGFRAGLLDSVLMRLVDVLLSLPPMLVILVFMTLFPRNNLVIVALVAILLTPGAARVIRGLTQEVAGLEFIASAEAAGERTGTILLREILPNVRGRLAVELVLRTGFALLLISSLNFLGVGVSPPTPDWGLSINEGRNLLAVAPWISLFPALAIFVVIVSFNLAADSSAELWA